jgi:hypothetical protein
MSSREVLSTVFPQLSDVVVDGVELRGEVLQIVARTCVSEAACPGCGVLSQRVPTRYERHLADAAVGGREVRITLTVRRFRCSQARCERSTFAEQIPALASRYQRRTTLLTGVLEAIAVMLAGRPGARPAQRLRVAVSRSSLLRLLRAVPAPDVGALTAIGIDDCVEDGSTERS